MDILSIALGIGTAIGGCGTAFLYWETRGQGAKVRRQSEIDSRIASAVHQVTREVLEIRTRMDSESAHLTTIIKGTMAEQLAPVKDQIRVLDTKIDPLWKALEGIMIDQVRGLHHPDPDRADLDSLLDKVLDAQETGVMLTFEEEQKLRRYLVMIKNWHPGQDLGFTVYPNEPLRAAILLRTLELFRIRKHQEHYR